MLKDNLTDFEKLLFALRYIKELKAEIKNLNVEVGVLKSEVSELNYRLKYENPSAHKMGSYKAQIKSTREKCLRYQLLYERLLAKTFSQESN